MPLLEHVTEAKTTGFMHSDAPVECLTDGILYTFWRFGVGNYYSVPVRVFPLVCTEKISHFNAASDSRVNRYDRGETNS